jgi:hypothetical protein
MLQESPPDLNRILRIYRQLIRQPVLINGIGEEANVIISKRQLIEKLLLSIDQQLREYPAFRHLIYAIMTEHYQSMVDGRINLVEAPTSTVSLDLQPDFMPGLEGVSTFIQSEDEEIEVTKAKLGMLFTILKENKLFTANNQKFDKFFSEFYGLEDSNWSNYVRVDLKDTIFYKERFSEKAIIDVYHILKLSTEKIKESYQKFRGKNIDERYTDFLRNRK